VKVKYHNVNSKNIHRRVTFNAEFIKNEELYTALSKLGLT